MNIYIQHGLPFVPIKVKYKEKELALDKVLLDTGSAGSIFNTDVVRQIGVIPENNDVVETIRGVGGVEYVYTKYFNEIFFGNISISNFQVEIGSMDYGMDIDGILGFDFISSLDLIIDTQVMEVYSKL